MDAAQDACLFSLIKYRVVKRVVVKLNAKQHADTSLSYTTMSRTYILLVIHVVIATGREELKEKNKKPEQWTLPLLLTMLITFTEQASEK